MNSSPSSSKTGKIGNDARLHVSGHPSPRPKSGKIGNTARQPASSSSRDTPATPATARRPSHPAARKETATTITTRYPLVGPASRRPSRAPHRGRKRK